METENSRANGLPTVLHGLLPFAVPALLISIGYVDPGKWVATVEGGAHFGCDLVVLMLVFNFAAILCQYLSARIGVVTGRDLAQICVDEYDTWTCMALGVQTEFSMILLDLTMVLGIAHGLNHLFEWDLFTCVFLTAINAVLFPLFSTLMENHGLKSIGIYVAGFVLASSVLGVLINHPEMTHSMNGTLTKLNGESVFTLMSLLGATIMPHNFYLHSSIVQHHRGPANISKDTLCHNHFFAILCVFSGIYVVNYVLMSSAATAFYSTGLVLLNFQDAMSLVEQVFKGPLAPIAFLLVLFVANQITALTWGFGGQIVLHDFLKLDIPGWLHCATIRIIAIIPALYCVWSSGAEGMYQLLIFTQVLVALLLPSSVIPLFRVAASRQIMGSHKIPQIVEFLTLMTFVMMLILKVAFVVEMAFGNSDWVGNLWNVGSGVSASYIVLLFVVCASFCLMLWLAATPLKSASEAWKNWDSLKSVPDLYANKDDDIDITKRRFHTEAVLVKHEPSPVVVKPSDSQPDVKVEDNDFNLPESIMDHDPEFQLPTVDEPNLLTEPEVKPETVPDAVVISQSTSKEALNIPVEKRSLVVEPDLQAEKDDYDADTWDTDDLSKGVLPETPTFQSDGPGSFRSLSSKSDDGGNGAGSLSRLAGLGRAARRQLAAVLDEFWGQLYDFHGQPTQEARAKKLDLLFGLDPKTISSTNTKELPSFFQSPNQHISQRSSGSWSSNSMQLSDPYAQSNSNRNNAVDSGERRYSSVRNLPSSDSWGDYQPATVHGYQISSLMSRLAKERNSEHLNGQIQSQAIKSSLYGASPNYSDSIAYAMGQKLQNGLSASQVSPIQSQLASRNSMMQNYGFPLPGTAENLENSSNTKKYHSSPNIIRELYASADRAPQWENSGGFGSSVTRTTYENSVYSNSGSSKSGGPLKFDNLSPSGLYIDALSSPANLSFGRSLWSRQPHEAFGVADSNNPAVESGIGRMTIPSSLDSEAKLLQAFRNCIVKLLKLEGSDWLFRQNDGTDEELIERVAAREKYLCEVEAREMSRVSPAGESHYASPEQKYSSLRSAETNLFAHSVVSSVPHCGEGCVWKSDLIVSFGVWCIHRVLDLSLMESRPELWGKYTYVLNRLQGIVDASFSKPRAPKPPCFCLVIPASAQQRMSPPVSNGMLPPAAKPARGKCTTAPAVLDMIKDVEIAISCRKGRTGTAAGDVAFPKGKENLASVLKRYKRRLANKPTGNLDGPGSRKLHGPTGTYGP